MKKLTLAILVVGLLVAMALPAEAKLVGTASISGPGIGGPAVFDIRGTMFMSGRDGAGYPTMARFLERGRGAHAPPAGSLGPRYVARFRVDAPPWGTPVVQHLYPYAAGGPVQYTPPMQKWIGGRVPPGWFPMSAKLLEALRDRGLPTVSPLPPAAAVSRSSTASPLWGVVLLGGLLFTSATVGRRKLRVPRLA